MTDDIATLIFWGLVFLGFTIHLSLELSNRWQVSSVGTRLLYSTFTALSVAMVLIAAFGLYWQLFVRTQ